MHQVHIMQGNLPRFHDHIYRFGLIELTSEQLLIECKPW